MVGCLEARRAVAGLLATSLLVASLAGCGGGLGVAQTPAPSPEETVAEEPGEAPGQGTSEQVPEAVGVAQGDAAASEPAEQGKIVILATGGTIAGVGEKGKNVGYESGTLTVDQLVDDVPEIGDVAPIEVAQVCNVNSDDITSEIWLDLADEINTRAADADVAGFVVTHGTDTLEETAYFLNLVVKTGKPVVVTGAMHPATSVSADGKQNLLDAVRVAASPEAHDKGVLVVFADRIYSAHDVAKTSTYYVGAIASGEEGSIGVVRDDDVRFFKLPLQLHTTETEFDVSGLTSLPRVSIVLFNVDADPELLTYAAQHADGIVIAGAGAGEYSQDFAKVINGLDKPVVVSSRIGDGIITQKGVLCENTVAANSLSPQKAAILLRLALATGDASFERLLRLFATY